MTPRKFLASVVCIGMLAMSSEVNAMKYFAQTPDMIASTTPYGNNSAAAHRAQSGDAKIHYEVYGKGDPIVILHGGGLGSSYEMGGFIDKLRKDHQVLVISTRGHGRSEIGHSDFTLKQRADDINAVLNDAKIKKAATLIGFSDGGYSAYSFAVNYPKRINKLITIGAGEVLQTNKFFVFNLDDWRKYDADFVDQQQAIMPEPDRWPEMLKMYEKMWNGAIISKETFSKIACPTLLINGEKDINSPMLTAIAAYHEIPDAQIAIIPNAPHQCGDTHFDIVWPIVKRFIGG